MSRRTQSSKSSARNFKTTPVDNDGITITYYESRVTRQRTAWSYDHGKRSYYPADKGNHGYRLQGHSGQLRFRLKGHNSGVVEGMGSRIVLRELEDGVLLYRKDPGPFSQSKNSRLSIKTSYGRGIKDLPPSARHQTPVVGKAGRIYCRSLSQWHSGTSLSICEVLVVNVISLLPGKRPEPAGMV